MTAGTAHRTWQRWGRQPGRPRALDSRCLLAVVSIPRLKLTRAKRRAGPTMRCRPAATMNQAEQPSGPDLVRAAGTCAFRAVLTCACTVLESDRHASADTPAASLESMQHIDASCSLAYALARHPFFQADSKTIALTQSNAMPVSPLHSCPCLRISTCYAGRSDLPQLEVDRHAKTLLMQPF
ncbi:hypothetical protein BCV70DRAFT_22327 [Testicularia cyperi]|uniref:Uncharacterized protein n=1 Tax=Testicularia cyperi TaxID=1882483 RepID=A0A317Y279_9BASI|nr:hypothetical protein BCV70DRAFT_22327 [Testicularia cyperi]